MFDRLVVQGAREHNLRSVDLDLPRDQLIVFTGLSGEYVKKEETIRSFRANSTSFPRSRTTPSGVGAGRGTGSRCPGRGGLWAAHSRRCRALGDTSGAGPGVA